MKKNVCLGELVIIFGVILISGCTPKPQQEFRNAENAITRAQRADAQQWAPVTYAQAVSKFNEGKNLFNKKKYSQAKQRFEQALVLAENSIREANDAQTQAKKKTEIQQPDEPPTADLRHTVAKGECLWYIAGYSTVYSDPYQWKRIHRANADKIQNPDLIYPGQVFVIPR